MGELWKGRVTFTPTANVGWGGTWTGLIRAAIYAGLASGLASQGVEEGRRFDPATSVVGIVGVIDEAAPDGPHYPSVPDLKRQTAPSATESMKPIVGFT